MMKNEIHTPFLVQYNLVIHYGVRQLIKYKEVRSKNYIPLKCLYRYQKDIFSWIAISFKTSLNFDRSPLSFDDHLMRTNNSLAKNRQC